MDEIEKILSDEVRKKRTPSIQYSVFDQNSIIKSYAFGFSDIENHKEAGAETTYNAYSVTKTFTALAILQLAQSGILNINDNVRDHLPDFPYNPAITIRQVLSHSAGIPNPIPLAWIHLPSENKTFNRDEFFNNILIKSRKSTHEPDAKFSYSNLGYVLLGRIIEKMSGMKYEKYIQNHIINVLGIPATEMSFEIQDPGKHATGYHKKSSLSNMILGFFIDKKKYMAKSGVDWKPFKPFYVNGPSYGGLIGTPDAFIKYIRELLNPDCRLITDEYRKLLFAENFTSGGKPSGMCLSWFKGRLNGKTYYTHAGGGGGYYCEIRIYPDQGIGSVVFFNRTGMTDQRFLDTTDGPFL